MRRALVLAFAALLLVPLPARAAGPVRLTIGVVGPIDGGTPAAREIFRLQYPTLTTYDLTTLAPIPGLAEAWTPVDDGFTYTLRDVSWSDGQPVLAQDVVYSLDIARDDFPGLTAELVDDKRVTITGLGTVPALPLPIIPRHAPDDPSIGAGDWRIVERSDREVRFAVFERPGRPALDEIVFRSYPDTGALMDALADGEVDVAAGFEPSDYPALREVEGATAIHANDGDQWVLQVRAEELPVRQAIARAIDRDALVQRIAHGAGRPQSIPVVARDAKWTPADDLDLGYAPGAAKALLAEAQAVPDLTLAADDDALADAVIEALAAVGITVERVDGSADLTIVLRDPTDDPTPALAAYTCAGGDVFCDAQYEAAFAQYEATHDPALVHDMVRQLAREGVEVVLFAPDEVQAYRSDDVQGLLQPPEVVRLVTMWPSQEQYRQASAAIPQRAEEMSTAAFVVLACSVLAVFAAAAVVIELVRRRRSGPPVDRDVEAALGREGLASERSPT